MKKFPCFGAETLVRHIEILFSLMFVEKFRNKCLNNMSSGVVMFNAVQLGM